MGQRLIRCHEGLSRKSGGKLNTFVVKITAFRYVMPYSMLDGQSKFGETCCLHSGDFYPKDRRSSFLVKVGAYIPDYTASHPRREYSL